MYGITQSTVEKKNNNKTKAKKNLPKKTEKNGFGIFLRYWDIF